MTNIIQVTNLQKNYGDIQAVKGISFQVKEGSLFAFLGKNGAGKSTTIEILCTLLAATDGEVRIHNETLGTMKGNDAIRKSIGVVFQQSLLDERLTVFENISHRGKMYGLSKQQFKINYDFVSSYLKLEDIAHKKYGQLSGGQKRRADIARALIHRPKILFLDEPTTGLDPQTRQFVWQAIKRLQLETNMTVFLTTHYMEEAAVADHVVIIKSGEIVAEGTPDALKTQYAFDQLEVVFHNEHEGEHWLHTHAINFNNRNSIFSIRVDSTMHALALLKQMENHIASFEVIKGTMDDVFIHINEEGAIDYDLSN